MAASPTYFSKECFFIPSSVESHLASLAEKSDPCCEISAYLQDLLNSALPIFYLEGLKKASYTHIKHPLCHEQFLQKLFLRYIKQGCENKAFELLTLNANYPLDELSDIELDKCLHQLMQIHDSAKALPIAFSIGLAYIQRDHVMKGLTLWDLEALNETDKKTLQKRLMNELQFDDLSDRELDKCLHLLMQIQDSAEALPIACAIGLAYIQRDQESKGLALCDLKALNKSDKKALRATLAKELDPATIY